jgi:hypothetical protein
VPGDGLHDRRVIERWLAAAIREGVPLDAACEALGLSRSTPLLWARQARAGHPAYQRWLKTLDCARLERRARIAELLADARRDVARAQRARQRRAAA